MRHDAEIKKKKQSRVRWEKQPERKGIEIF